MLLNYDRSIYDVTPLGPGQWWVLSPSGQRYAIEDHPHPHGPECDCADFVMRRQHQDGRGCKHIRALRASGLIPE